MASAPGLFLGFLFDVFFITAYLVDSIFPGSPRYSWDGVAHLGIGRELPPSTQSLGMVWQMTTTLALGVTAPGPGTCLHAADWWQSKYPYLGLPLQGCIMRRGAPSQRFIPCASTSTACLLPLPTIHSPTSSRIHNGPRIA